MMILPALACLAIWPGLDNANTLGNTEINFVDQTMLEGEAITAFRASPLHGGTTKIVVVSFISYRFPRSGLYLAGLKI